MSATVDYHLPSNAYAFMVNGQMTVIIGGDTYVATPLRAGVIPQVTAHQSVPYQPPVLPQQAPPQQAQHQREQQPRRPPEQKPTTPAPPGNYTGLNMPTPPPGLTKTSAPATSTPSSTSSPTLPCTPPSTPLVNDVELEPTVFTPTQGSPLTTPRLNFCDIVKEGVVRQASRVAIVAAPKKNPDGDADGDLEDDAEDRSQRPVCRYWLKNKCFAGDSCTFRHDHAPNKPNLKHATMLCFGCSETGHHIRDCPNRSAWEVAICGFWYRGVQDPENYDGCSREDMCNKRHNMDPAALSQKEISGNMQCHECDEYGHHKSRCPMPKVTV